MRSISRGLVVKQRLGKSDPSIQGNDDDALNACQIRETQHHSQAKAFVRVRLLPDQSVVIGA